MLSATSSFLAVLFATVPPALGAPASLEATAQAIVRLKLNKIETAKLLNRYAFLIQREMDLQGSVKACVKSADTRLQEYKDALTQAQDDLETTKKKLVDLEVEKAKLIEQFGKPESADASAENIDRLNRNLEKILERLTTIEKRLEKK
jgi:septal ring factor EnvC (AmiA/AmiB activator)